MEGYSRHQSQSRSVDSIQQTTRPNGVANLWNEWIRYGDKNKRREKNPERGEQRTWRTTEQISNEGRGGEERTRRDLPNGNRVKKLLIGEPAQPKDKIRAQKRQQNISTSIQDGTDF